MGGEERREEGRVKWPPSRYEVLGGKEEWKGARYWSGGEEEKDGR